MLDLAFRNILRHKIRSILTITGIGVGIGLIIALGSIGIGLTSSIEEGFSELAGVVQVSPIGGGGIPLETVDELKNIEGVERVVPISTYIEGGFTHGAFTVSSESTVLIAIDPEDQDYIIGREIIAEEGRKFDESDDNDQVAVIGWGIADRKNLNLGDDIEYKNYDFEVIGILEETSGDTNSIFVPLSTMLEIEEEENIQSVRVIVSDIEYAEDVAEDINENIDDILALSFKSLSRQLGGILDTINLAVMGIGAISAVVGGLGIMNTMIMSVMERRREIGIMKAIGAENSTILKQVLEESGMLSLVGGALGLLLGWLAAFTISSLSGFNAIVAPWLALAGIGFALIIGMGAGVYPAWSASRLDPIEVLRYE